MKIENKSETFTAKHVFNLVKGKSMADAVGSTVEVVAACVGEDISNDTGELVKTGYIVTAAGEIYNTISKTARQQIDAMCDMLNEDDEPISVKICDQKCKNDKKRSFVFLEMV